MKQDKELNDELPGDVSTYGELIEKRDGHMRNLAGMMLRCSKHLHGFNQTEQASSKLTQTIFAEHLALVYNVMWNLSDQYPDYSKYALAFTDLLETYLKGTHLEIKDPPE